MRSLQHFDAKLEIKSMAGNLYPLVLMIMVNMVYIMITLANDIPHICHFFTQAKFFENKIYTEIYTVNGQFTQ